MHPYTQNENSEIWRVLEKSIRELIENQDIEITTKEKYVTGYITKQVINTKVEEGE